MEGYYDSDDDVCWGPYTLKEAKRDLTDAVGLPNINCRHSHLGVLNNNDKMESKPKVKEDKETVELAEQMKLNLSISDKSSSEYFTPDGSIRSEPTSVDEFIEKLKKAIGEPSDKLESSSAKGFSEELKTHVDEFHAIEKNNRVTLLENIEQSLIENTIILSSDDEDESIDIKKEKSTRSYENNYSNISSDIEIVEDCDSNSNNSIISKNVKSSQDDEMIFEESFSDKHESDDSKSYYSSKNEICGNECSKIYTEEIKHREGCDSHVTCLDEEYSSNSQANLSDFEDIPQKNVRYSKKYCEPERSKIHTEKIRPREYCDSHVTHLDEDYLSNSHGNLEDVPQKNVRNSEKYCDTELSYSSGTHLHENYLGNSKENLSDFEDISAQKNIGYAEQYYETGLLKTHADGMYKMNSKECDSYGTHLRKKYFSNFNENLSDFEDIPQKNVRYSEEAFSSLDSISSEKEDINRIIMNLSDDLENFDPAPVISKDSFITSQNSHQTLELDDTLQEMEMALKYGLDYKMPGETENEISYAAHSLKAKEGNRESISETNHYSEFHIKSSPSLVATETISQTNYYSGTHIPKLLRRDKKTISNTPNTLHKKETLEIATPHSSQKSPHNLFKKPSKPLKITPMKSPLNSLMFKNIISPVGVYIKNSPAPILKQNIMARASPSVVREKQPEVKVLKPIENTEIPEIIYKPAKRQVLYEKKDKPVPNSIKKLIQEPTIIKHQGRSKSKTCEAQVARKLLQQELTYSCIDDSTLDLTSDVSILSSKRGFIK